MKKTLHATMQKEQFGAIHLNVKFKIRPEINPLSSIDAYWHHHQNGLSRKFRHLPKNRLKL